MLANREVDYRIIYMDEASFERRVYDVYMAKQTHHRAPYFVDILEELIDVECALFLLHRREDFNNLSEDEYDTLYKMTESGDPEAIQLVCEKMDATFVEQFARDLFLHLMERQFVFMERDLYRKDDVQTHNQVLQEVW